MVKHFVFIAFACLILCASGFASSNQMPVGYDNGFYIRSADSKFLFKANAYLQTRMDIDLNGASSFPNFYINSGQAGFGGYAFCKCLEYKFEADFTPAAVSLKDYYVDFTLLPSVLQVQVGKFKARFGRQIINHSEKLSFVDLAITNQFFTMGRPVGIMLHNGSKEPIEWAIGMFTEGGYARIGYNYGNIDGYTEQDFSRGPFRFALAFNGNMVRLEENTLRKASYAFGPDAIIKYRGFTSTGGLFLGGDTKGGTKVIGSTGAYIQGGYLINSWFEPSLRYAYHDNQITPVKHEVAAALSAYAMENNVKIQLEGLALIQNKQARGFLLTQLQLAF